MSALDDTYRRLARPWTRDELAACYAQALRGAAALDDAAEKDGSLALIALAIPPAAALEVAVHILHGLTADTRGEAAQALLTTGEKDAATALERCHRALELDGKSRAYSADEWLSTIYDIAASLLNSARLERELPTLVRDAQDAISWLSRAVVELAADSTEAPSSIAEASARLLAVWAFTDTARRRGGLGHH